MFSPKLSTVFASRWKALWWSASIMLTAYCTVPSQEDDVQSGDGVQLAEASKPDAHSKNPWAIASPSKAAGDE